MYTVKPDEVTLLGTGRGVDTAASPIRLPYVLYLSRIHELEAPCLARGWALSPASCLWASLVSLAPVC